jgi:hypothetical protein
LKRSASAIPPRLLGAQLLAEGGLAGQRIRHFAERGLDRLLVLGHGDVAAGRGALDAGAARPKSNSGRIACGAKVQPKEPLLNRPDSSVLALPALPVSEMRGK